ncbi:MAG: hypothetical protein ACTIL0_09970, partial [Microbacterium gubbeenense]
MPQLPEIDPAAVLLWAIAALNAVIVIVLALVAIRITRRGRGARARARARLEGLGASLVELDDAADELEIEIAMSSALYDGRPPSSLRRARLTAQHTRDDAFAAYSAAAADGVLPAVQRREAARLTAGIDKAMAVIQSARAENEAWVSEHTTAVEQIAVARGRLEDLRTRMGDPAALRAELARIADESEWEDAADADADARDALNDASAHLAEAESQAEADPSSSAREHLRSCERSLAHAEHSARLLEETYRLVGNARQAIDDETRAAESAIRAAMGTQKTLDADAGPKLAEAIRVAEAALAAATEVAE